MAGGEESSGKVADDSVTKHEAGSPENVGKSTTRSGEDVRDDEGKEAGRHDAGPKGKTGRPAGTSTSRDSTGVGPQDPIDEKSPYLQTP